MFRGNNGNTAAPPLLDNHFLYPADMSNQLQSCGNLPAEFHANPVNYIGNNHGTPFLLPNKCVRDDEAITRQQKLQISLNNRTFPDEADRKVSILNQNPVSTGLRLSYDDDERNSSITSGSGSLTAASSVFSSLSNDIRRELDQQKEEVDQFIKSQEETMMKGVRDIQQRHMASFLTALEKGVVRKLHEKDLELQTVTHKNKELIESVKQVTNEAQNWCYMAKCNESVINILKTNLQQAMQNSNRGKEGLGESNVDDAASCIDPNNYLGVAGGSGRSGSVKKDMMCKSCKAKQMITTASFEVYLS
ncbi:UNVERIFIED_CONTAM: hypothetical protein Sradi_4825300 [Sesamum radiatum]|uniref:BOI-related E3 ubiquitin-protein ligase 2 n=1 Tax=Sesamum radiatum TaxID=300843 RepID=A0AAW2MXA0_SESRA